MRAVIIVKGIVQGVGFRPFIYRIAVKNKLVGYVRNRGDAGVEIIVQGDKSNIERFILNLRENNPPQSRIYDMNIDYHQDDATIKKFEIKKSYEGGNIPGSVIPPDISICENCTNELRDKKNRRYRYFFITCTNCGPRYTTIEKLPYDRPNITMRNFQMCEECRKDYSSSLNIRFHAQTIACEDCGPQLTLVTNKGEHVEYDDPILETGKLIGEGNIVSIKGNGGFHIATSTTISTPISRLRKSKHRSQKPFAIMARNLTTIKSFANMNSEEERLITSPVRPILLLNKKREYYLSDLISPGLHNIGVMLPYTGLHHLLYEPTSEPAFVMTSGNAPNEPIIIQNKDALQRLGRKVDYFLLHDRKIAQRCDDSVARIIDKDQKIIRRSRGYVPTPIRLKKSSNERSSHLSILGVGAELNVTICILTGDKAYLSQHIGDVENLNTFKFLQETTKHIINLTKSKIDLIACDMHPRFVTAKYAEESGRDSQVSVIPVQHHHAHIESLLGEYGLDEIIGICCDGYGYGQDGKAWGGEILLCDQKGFKRMGHLQEQPIVGGDLATRYPLRIVAGIICLEEKEQEWLISKAKHFPHGMKEVEIILKQLMSKNIPTTTSCGRILDAVSALLGICFERTYEGEPAMKLESSAINGKDVLKIEPYIKDGVIDTTWLLRRIFEEKNRYSISDLAYSAEKYLAKSLAAQAVDIAKDTGVKSIGLSGGVAYNKHITFTIKEIVEEEGLRFKSHIQIPPGDAGISFGQAIAVRKKAD